MRTVHVLSLIMMTVLVLGAATAFAQDGDTVPGAIWKYEMKQVSGRGEPRTGAFRIDGDTIYQPRDRKPTKIGSIAGKPNQRPKQGHKVKVQFEALRASDGSELKCGGMITWQSLGEVDGRLIDSDGFHWTFKASRFKE